MSLAVILKHPELPDYFTEVDGNSSIVEEYEAGKVIVAGRPLDINTNFWASLVEAERAPVLKKLLMLLNGEPLRDLTTFGLPSSANEELARVRDQILPLYKRLFGGYRFTKPKAALRLHTIHAENLHVDLYKSEYPEHTARLFINLDNQPRIWQTSYTFEQMFEKYSEMIPKDVLLGNNREDIRRALCLACFGQMRFDRWDNQPRHVAFFDPGEVWMVDVCQVSHQIFYGRRAMSVDFLVDAGSMKRPDSHRHAMVDRLRHGMRS